MPIDRCIAGDIVQSARNSIGNDSGNQIPHCFWCNRALNSLLTTFLTFCVLSLAVGSSLLAKQNVLTWHNNNARTGEDLHETILTPANVKPSTFGKLFVIHVDGKVDAQPLYLANVFIPGKGRHNVLYVATEHDSVYAFDADNGHELWHVSMLKPREFPYRDPQCGQVTPVMGVTATPVIDPSVGPHGTI